MKRLIYIFLSVIILFGCTTYASAYVIDGKKKGTEWENSTAILLLNGAESNNKIDFGSVNWAIEEDGSLFLCFNYIEKNISADASLTGISLIVEDSEEFIVTVATSSAESDSSAYRFEGAVSVDEAKSCTCEIRVGAKLGLPSEISIRARFIDSEGSYSNVYDFTIRNSTYTYTPYYPDDSPETPNYTTTKSTQTTSVVTENTTNKVTTTKRSSSNTTRKTGFGLLEYILSDEDKTTTTTKVDKTTKKSSERTSIKNNKTDVIIDNTTSSLNEQTSVTNQNNFSASTNQISTTEGSKYKLITAVFGGIALVSVAILGTLGANKKANKKNNKDKKEDKED